MKLSVYLNPLFDDESFVDRVARAADAGADGFELGTWGTDDVEGVAAAADDHGVQFHYVSGLVPATNDPDAVDERVADVEATLDRIESLGVSMLNVSPGEALDDHSRDAQFDATAEVLRRAAPAAEAAGVTLLVEPLNTRVDHPGVLLSTAADAWDLVDAADSPNVGVLFDVYHQQITEGDVTRRLTENVEQVGHVHVADNPGRHEPGTGEIDYGNVLAALDEAGYDGYVGCEFEPTGDPETAIDHVRSLLPS